MSTVAVAVKKKKQSLKEIPPFEADTEEKPHCPQSSWSWDFGLCHAARPRPRAGRTKIASWCPAGLRDNFYEPFIDEFNNSQSELY